MIKLLIILSLTVSVLIGIMSVMVTIGGAELAKRKFYERDNRNLKELKR